jgi:hypothetical protein
MSKKLLIYGLAFGSAAAALSYIYMIYVAFNPNLSIHLISVLGEFILIPGTAIFLFLRSTKQSNQDEFFIGRAIFLGFFLSLIISSSVSLFFSYIAQFRPEIINGFIDLKVNQLVKSKFFTTLSEKDRLDNINAVKDSYSVAGQFKYQLYLGAARGLFLSAIIAFILKAKTKRG